MQPKAAGQERIRRTLTITADADDPRLTLHGPADGFETATATVDLRGRVDDATPVEVSIDGEVVARVKAGGGAFSTQVALQSVGSRAIEVVARDAAGRTTRMTRTVVRLDTSMGVMILRLDSEPGNVREWVQDWLAGYPAGAQIDPVGPTSGSIFRATRGGNWHSGSVNCRATERLMVLPDKYDVDLGFRAARSSEDR